MSEARSPARRRSNRKARQEQAPSSKAPQHIELSIGGMTCAHCPPAVEKALKAIDGVVSAHVNLANKLAAVDYDPSRARVIDFAKVIRAAGYVPGAATVRIAIKHMHCSSCVIRIELALQMTPGVLSARASLGTNAVDVEYDPS
ncbi:MAG: copper ion binding protein, partial [Terriglobia bacterium]